MNCPDRKRLETLLNRVLDAEAERELREHLRECDACRAIYDELTAIDDLVGSTPVELPGDDYLQSLSDEIQEKLAGDSEDRAQKTASILRGVFWSVTEAAAAFFVICAVSTLLSFEAPRLIFADKDLNVEDEISEMITARGRISSVEPETGGISIRDTWAIGMEI